MPYSLNENVLNASLNKTFLSSFFSVTGEGHKAMAGSVHRDQQPNHPDL